MSGKHRATHETNKARVGVAGALTAGALLLAPVGAVLVVPGIAHAVGAPGGGTGGTGGGTGGTNTPPPGDGGPADPGGSIGGGNTTHKKIIRLPGLKIEIKNTVGDHKPPTIKVVPFPGLNRILHPQTGPNVPPPPPVFQCTGHGPVDLSEHPECGGSGSGGGTG